jgi:hypothetical protein
MEKMKETTNLSGSCFDLLLQYGYKFKIHLLKMKKKDKLKGQTFGANTLFLFRFITRIQIKKTFRKKRKK